MRIPLIAILALLFASACGPPPRSPEPDDLFWPLSPEQPRIKYIRSIYSEDDIGRVYSFKEKLFGKTYVDFMTRPYGVFARYNKIYVADIGVRRVLVFDLDAKRMRILGEEGALHMPSAVVADATGATYVADAAQAKIAVYDAGGSYRTAYPLGDVRPVALAINEALNRLYVLDRNGNKVVVLKRDGTVLFEFGAKGSADGRFNMPLGISVDSTGKVYVLDSGNFRVQIFDADGKFTAKFGAVGDRVGFFANPKGIAVDSEGHIYVSDAAFSNFQIFDDRGNILLFIGELGAKPGQTHLPAGISIDEHDQIYVADQLNGRVEVFQYLKAP